LNPTTLQITELPVGRSTQSYKEFLESLVELNEIIDYKNNCDDTLIDFKIILQKTIIDGFTGDDILKKFKLSSIINTTNMHVFDENCKIRKVACPEEIILRFYEVRKRFYKNRKIYLINKLERSLTILESKIQFIKMVMDDRITVFRKKKEDILAQIRAVKPALKQVDDTHDYLLEMKIHVFTEEKIKELETLIEKERAELDILKKTTVETMWKTELNKI
jgi:DNA topoisomerase-2